MAEAAIHVALDQITKLGESHPLEALDSALEFLQKFNFELSKCFMPPVLAAAQEYAMINQSQLAANTMRVSQHLTKEQARSIGAMAQLQEAIAKIGVARVKIRDELARRQKLEA